MINRILFWLSASAFRAALERRAATAHDAVVGFSETVLSGTIGELYLKYKPYLKSLMAVFLFLASTLRVTQGKLVSEEIKVLLERTLPKLLILFSAN